MRPLLGSGGQGPQACVGESGARRARSLGPRPTDCKARRDGRCAFMLGPAILPAMDYVGRIFRPPSEANSLLLQVSVGCSHNRCGYCDMYRDKRFTIKPWEVVERDIASARSMGPRFRKMFLCDGDALILPTKR